MREITPELAELAGLFCADGCMQKGYICFWGNISEDRVYYKKVVSKLFEKAFNVKVRPHEKKSNSVYGFYVCNRRIINYFRSLGFNPGKKTFTVSVPKTILENKDRDIICAFLRGFMAGDGCLNFDKRWGKYQKILQIIHTYPRVFLSSVSKPLIKDIKNMLDRIGIKSFIYTNYNRRYKNFSTIYRIEIKGKERLELWANKIGFRNFNHKTRYDVYKKFGFVPPNTTVNERKEILKNEISIWGYYPSWTRGLVDKAPAF